MKKIYYSALALLVAGMSIVNLQAQNSVGFDTSATWNGYMNVFDLGGGYQFGNPWGLGDLKSTINTSCNTLTLQPNFNVYDSTDAYYTDPVTFDGAKMMEANTYVESSTLFNGADLTFSGYVASNTLAAGYTAKYFIKALDPSTGYSDALGGSATLNLPASGNFTVSVTAAQLTAGLIVQYGFQIYGLNANPADEAALGSVVVTNGVCNIGTSISGTDASVFGASDGEATVTTSCGQGNLTYLWSNGSASNSATGLAAGTYDVTITDDVAAGCAALELITITEPALTCNIIATMSQNNYSCFGESDGDAMVLAAGGQGNISYVWSGGETTTSISGLVAGVYSVTVADDILTGCEANGTVTITEPAALLIAISGNDPTCIGGATDGDVAVAANGGPTTGYVYLWDNAATNATQTGLAGAEYFVTVTSGACSAIDSFTLNVAVATSMTVNASICEGESYFAGGLNQDTSGTFVDVYTAVNGCDSVIITNLTANPIPAVTVTASFGAICEGATTTLTASGTAGSTYLWDNAGVLNDNTIAGPVATPANGLTLFTVTITKNGCSDTSSIAISVQELPTLAIVEDVNAAECNDTITVTSTATSFFWTSPVGTQTTSANEIVVVVTNGVQVYTVVGTDDFGCSSAEATINVSGNLACSPLTIEEAVTSRFTLYPNPNNGSFSIEFAQEGNNAFKVLDITGKVVYQELANAKAASINLALSSGVYFVEVTNNNNVTTEKVVIK